jgi:hypothetical protein
MASHGDYMTCLFGAQLPMNVDVYEEYSSVNKKTGQKIKDWQYVKTIACKASPLESTISRSDLEKYTARAYDLSNVIEIVVLEKIDGSARLANIRLGSEVLYEEDNDQPTIFEIMGRDPLIDPFGGVNGYRMACARSADQRLYP